MSDIITQEPAQITNAPPAPVSEDMSPAEKAYFSSRGQDTEALFKSEPAKAEPAKTNGDQRPAVDAKAPALDVEAPADTDPDDVTLGDDGKGRDKQGRFVRNVPHQVFHKERERRKAADEALTRTRDELIRTREREAILLTPDAPAATAKAEPPKKIDPNEDIIGAYAQLESEVGEMKAWKAEQAKSAEAARVKEAVSEQWRKDASAFSAKQADFPKAVEAVIRSHAKRYEVMGHDPAKIPAMVQKEFEEFFADQYARKSDPTQTLYKYATEVIGYKAEAAGSGANGSANGANGHANGKSPALAEIEAINRGQDAARTLRGSGVSGAPEQLTAAKLADMSDAQFRTARASYIEKHGASAWKQLLGQG